MVEQSNTKKAPKGTDAYVLDDQIGFIFRQAIQRHSVIFAERMIEGLTTTQFAVIAKLDEVGICSQNQLGRLTAMDAATIKGVVGRLGKRDFVENNPDITDGRRLLVKLTKKGKTLAKKAIPLAKEISDETLRPLALTDQKTLLRLLKHLR